MGFTVHQAHGLAISVTVAVLENILLSDYCLLLIMENC